MTCLISIIFPSLFLFCFSVIPNWSLEKSGKNLLLSSTYNYTVYEKEILWRKLKMTRNITKSNGNITYSNYVSLNEEKPIKVPFDNIQYFYYIFNTPIICPVGPYYPYNFTKGEYININNIGDIKNLDLKCMYHILSEFFIVSYSPKTSYNLFHRYYSYVSWDEIEFKGELYDLKINDNYYKGIGNHYPIIYYIKRQKTINFVRTSIKEDGKHHFDFNDIILLNEIQLLETFKKTKGIFRDKTDNFYFMTYDDIYNFSTGYTNSTFDENFDTSNYTYKINLESPFEFLEELEIKEINFLLRNKFLYYILKSKTTDKLYHGIIDIELNKIIFNTDETINTFIPYSDKAMLAITPTAAYKICVYNEGDNCTDNCTDGYVLDTSGNKCGTSCPKGKMKLIPHDICIDNCDTSINVIVNEECGLCKYFDSDKKYKFINGTKCLSTIPKEAELFNQDLFILKCKDEYHYQNDSCVMCFNTCKECYGTSNNETDQKCVECKNNLFLENGNCVCSNGFVLIGNECHSCDNNKCQIFSNNSCDCLECKEHYYLNESKCLDCDSNCKTCKNSANDCTSCYEHEFLLNNKCLKCTDCKEEELGSCKCKSCKEGFYLENYQCKNCSDNCKICDNNTECTSCNDGFVLEDGICLSQCSNGYELKENECYPCNNDKCKTFTNNTCNCSECKEHYYLNEKDCLDCDSNCKTCNYNSNHCTSCFNDSFLFNDQCLICTDCKEEEELGACKCKSCKEGFYLENYQCKNCSDNCKICDNNTECTSCNDGFVLEDGICLSQCSNGYELKENECYPCNNDKCKTFTNNTCNCSECHDSYYLNESKCLDCDYNCKTCKNRAKECTSCYEHEFLLDNQCLKC